MSHRRIVVLAGLLSAIVAGHVLVIAQTTHPLMGTWKLNLAKSKYDPANLAPKSTTVTIIVNGDALRVLVDTVDWQSRAAHHEYTARFDGKDYPWKGTIDGAPNLTQDAVSWTKMDDYTYEVVSKLKGQPLTTQRTVIARDGKSRTNTVTGKNAQGQTVRNIAVFERQ